MTRTARAGVGRLGNAFPVALVAIAVVLVVGLVGLGGRFAFR